ncbi:MAG TPA: stalk domain-containing protein [Syntrophomonadaceae bacterium]|nr:stalk domain-containing protein [Syntrophomonadaceae bacterium]HPR92949.1 stalk domain-containing protein [Syntrophomonadaceae bacterium]
MRKSFILGLFLCLLFAVPAMASPSVIIDGQPLAFTDARPVIEQGRTLVPLRAIFEAMGANVGWNQDTRTVTAVKSGTTVVLQIGSSASMVNGQVKQLDVPAQIINGRTLVPLRFISEAFGAVVNWDSASQTVFIQTYTGPIHERIVNNDGSIYEGITQSGLYNGKGTMWWPNGEKYVGDWVNGLRNGQGTYTWPNGAMCSGNWVEGEIHGQGTYTWADGDKYVGNWIAGERTGQGTYTWPNGEKHVGEWKKGLKHGPGTAYYSDGGRIIGNWINGKLEGVVTAYLRNGDVIVAEYENDELIESSVQIISSNNSEYYNPEPVFTKPQVNTGIVTPLILVADDGKATFLGELTSNEFASDSIFNSFGTYGNEFSSKSIWNEFGRYGGEFSIYSPFNEFSLHPPMIIDGNGNIIGYLTVNEFKVGAISPYIIKQLLKDLLI